MRSVSPTVLAVLVAELAPAAAFGFAAETLAEFIARWPRSLRLLIPALFAIPYAVLATLHHMFAWQWLALYLFLPVAITGLLMQAAAADPEQRGNWRDAFILLTLGLAVDLRWFDSAWPDGLRGLGNLLLLDAGLYGFLGVRHLSGTGFDFHFRWRDWKIGLRELVFFAPAVIVLGLALGFIHPHTKIPPFGEAVISWIGIFVYIPVLEELFFRAWVQNLLERRVGRKAALVMASILFGLSHFNKRSEHFNWRYVLLATIAGIFYGRAWRQDRRVPASVITHTCVDWLWSWWF
jgi:membrane protease YdiL (CAAX protease family)